MTTTATGKDFESSKVSQIVKGKTTGDEIVVLFGTPSTEQAAENGETWVYSYATSTVKGQGFTPGGALAAILIPGSTGDVIASQNYNSTNSTGHTKTLTISLDKQRIVVDYTLHNSSF